MQSVSSMFPICSFEQIELSEANISLEQWGHKMGSLHRGNQGAICHALKHEGKIVAVVTASTTIRPNIGGGLDYMTRENTIELSRLCAERSGLCRVAIRLWREFVFPNLSYRYAVSYQDAQLHSGNTYRFDGWKRLARSRSGTDTRSFKQGRDKWIWVWEKK